MPKKQAQKAYCGATMCSDELRNSNALHSIHDVP